MSTAAKQIITVEATINAPVEKVWSDWTSTDAITKWNCASPDWHSPKAEHDLQPGGKFSYRMEAKDGSFGFDFEGVFDAVTPNEYLEYTIGDGRKVKITFTGKGNETHVSETFEAEETNSIELQRGGWQAILDNFKKYAETSSNSTHLHFEVQINAPVQKVYDTMIEKEQYKIWTAPFAEGSYFEGSWEEGAKILFVIKDDNGELQGMVSRIAENKPNKFISIEHLGMVKNGQEITEGEDIQKWAGVRENYTFTEADGGTVVAVDMHAEGDFLTFLQDTWPVALKKLKEISEK